jgi:uncharacterized protein (TIGR02598 family)
MLQDFLPGKRAGFSLIEICVALGIFAFAIVGLVGLMAYSLSASQSADSSAAMSAVTTTITSMLEGRDFASSSNLTQSNLYFSIEGKLLPDSSGAMYQCNLTNLVPLVTNTLGMQLQLVIRFPYPVLNQTNYVPVSYAKYN